MTDHEPTITAANLIASTERMHGAHLETDGTGAIIAVADYSAVREAGTGIWRRSSQPQGAEDQHVVAHRQELGVDHLPPVHRLGKLRDRLGEVDVQASNTPRLGGNDAAGGLPEGQESVVARGHESSSCSPGAGTPDEHTLREGTAGSASDTSSSDADPESGAA